MTANAKQVAAILKLPSPKRYSHFVKKVVGWRKLWGLYDEGWAMAELDDGAPVLPLWPEKEYAELSVVGKWATYQPREIELDEALDKMIPMLRERGIQPGVFYSAGSETINVTLEELERDLREELVKYE